MRNQLNFAYAFADGRETAYARGKPDPTFLAGVW